MQRDVGSGRPHRTSGIFSATKTESTQRGRGRTGPRMQGFGRQQGETSASETATRRSV